MQIRIEIAAARTLSHPLKDPDKTQATGTRKKEKIILELTRCMKEIHEVVLRAEFSAANWKEIPGSNGAS